MAEPVAEFRTSVTLFVYDNSKAPELALCQTSVDLGWVIVTSIKCNSFQGPPNTLLVLHLHVSNDKITKEIPSAQLT